MSFFPGKDPAPGDAPACDAIELMIVPRSVDLGGFEVRRALPHARRRMVGPFIFFDHFGPGGVQRRQGHRRAAASAYRARHRDLPVRRRDHASRQPRHRGADPARRGQLMTAGRGIVHSERTAPDHRAGGERLHGLQCWVAHAGGGRGDRRRASRITSRPSCRSWPRTARPCASSLGSLYGERSPVPTLSRHHLRRRDARARRRAADRRRHRGARALHRVGRDRHRGRPLRAPVSC